MSSREGYECDRCKTVHLAKPMPNKWISLDVSYGATGATKRYLHLCGECTFAFEAWLKNPRSEQ